MAKLDNKTLIASLLVLVVLAGTNVLTYFITKHDVESKGPTTTQAPEGSKPTSATDKLDKKAPANTVAISNIFGEYQKYTNQKVAVYGVVGQTPGGKLTIMDAGDKPAALILNLSNYKGTPPAANSIYIIEGTYVQDQSTPSQLIVESIKKQ